MNAQGEGLPISTCHRCGKRLGTFSRLWRIHCRRCRKQVEAERAVARRKYRQVALGLASGKLSPNDARSTLEGLSSGASLEPEELATIRSKAIEVYMDRVLADDLLSEEDEEEFDLITEALGVADASALQASIDRKLANRWLMARANAGRISEFPQEVSVLIRKKGEVVHVEVPASLMKRVTRRQYAGGYGGMSFRVAKGVRFHTGGFRGEPVVVGSDLREEDSGYLSITNKRAVFIGQGKTVEMPHSKLVSLNVFEDGIQFHLSNRPNAPLFKVESGELIATFVNAIFQELD